MENESLTSTLAASSASPSLLLFPPVVADVVDGAAASSTNKGGMINELDEHADPIVGPIHLPSQEKDKK